MWGCHGSMKCTLGRQQPNRFRWCIAASIPNRGKRWVCNKCLYLVYKSVRNLGFEITCLHKVNKGTVTTTSLASFSRTQSSGTIQEFDLRIYSVLFRNSSYYYCFTTHLLIIITKLSLQLIAVIRNNAAAVGHIPLVLSPSLPHPLSPDGNIRSHSVHQNEQARLPTCMNGLPLGPCRFVSHPADQLMRAHPYLDTILL